MLGVQRTAGSIRYSRGQIEILDRKALQRDACECYASVLDKNAYLLGARPFSEMTLSTPPTPRDAWRWRGGGPEPDTEKIE
jgi:hypothetical protein